MDEARWPASDAARLSGLSMHMLNYLARTDILPPAWPSRRKRQHGRRREYRFGDIVMLRALNDLTARGVSVLRLRPALRALRAEHASITATELPARFLLTSGETAIFVGADGIAKELTMLGMATIVLDVQSLRQDVLDMIDSDSLRS